MYSSKKFRVCGFSMYDSKGSENIRKFNQNNFGASLRFTNDVTIKDEFTFTFGNNNYCNITEHTDMVGIIFLDVAKPIDTFDLFFKDIDANYCILTDVDDCIDFIKHMKLPITRKYVNLSDFF